MIDIIGMKRIMLVAILIAVNAVMAGAVYAYLDPQSSVMQREVSSLKSQVMSKRADTDRLRSEYDQIQSQKSKFEDLKAIGFFADQNKILARKRIEAIQSFSKMITAKYNINAAEQEQDQQAEAAEHILFNSPIKVDVEAMDDVDFFNLIYWIENGFPGHVSIDNIKVERTLDINDAVLRQIELGVDTTLIKGSVTFNWRSMVPRSSLTGAPGGGGT